MELYETPTTHTQLNEDNIEIKTYPDHVGYGEIDVFGVQNRVAVDIKKTVLWLPGLYKMLLYGANLVGHNIQRLHEEELFNAYNLTSRAAAPFYRWELDKLSQGGLAWGCGELRYINIIDRKGVDGETGWIALFGYEFGVYLNPFSVSPFSFFIPHHYMSFSVDDLVSSLSESHISQEANDIAALQVIRSIQSSSAL